MANHKATRPDRHWEPCREPIPAHWMARVDRCPDCDARTFPSDARPVPGGFEAIYVCGRDRASWVTAWWGE